MAARAYASAVLVVEDHQDTRDILVLILKEAGYSVFSAPDGVSALTRLRTHPTPLVVVLDWLLPGRDGIAVLQAMATEAPAAQRHRYLLLTARPEAARPLLATLPADLSVLLVGKPFDVDTLLTLVAHAATQSHTDQQQSTQDQTAPSYVDEHSPKRQLPVRPDGRRSPALPNRSADQLGAKMIANHTSGTTKSLSQIFSQLQAADPSGDKLQTDAERLATDRRFHDLLERELTAELRTRLHLTLAGTEATFTWHGRSYTLTYAGFVERTTFTLSGGLASYTLRAWCVAPADKQELRNFAEGELQASLLAYLDEHSSL
jgi:two-component system, response regulator, stage 0 sporulation protein F